MANFFLDAGATFSACRKYRYRLWRTWNEALPGMVFIMLNPSTADDVRNDPTVERCQRRATRLAYGSLQVVNLFAWRSTDKSVLPSLADPVGPDNDEAIAQACAGAGMVVCGWGNDGLLRHRWREVVTLLRAAAVPLHALAVTGKGQPQHPLYIGYDRKPEPWR